MASCRPGNGIKARHEDVLHNTPATMTRDECELHLRRTYPTLGTKSEKLRFENLSILRWGWMRSVTRALSPPLAPSPQAESARALNMICNNRSSGCRYLKEMHPLKLVPRYGLADNPALRA